MILFARHSLVAHCEPAAREEPALLLEGDWPAADDRFAARYSLDESIDARHAWIDRTAAELAEQVAALPAYGFCPPGSESAVSLAWINALALRYYFVRLLRPIAFLDDTLPGRSATRIVLHADRHADEDYVHVLAQLCRRCGLHFATHWHESSPATPAALPRNGLLRRTASGLNRVLARPREERAAHPRTTSAVLLCGNPHVLGPVCNELVRRRCHVAWLYDRFAFGSFARWQTRGMTQFTCDSAGARHNGFHGHLHEAPSCRGVDLTAPLAAWLQRTCQQKGARQTRLVEQVERHFSRWRPDALVVDEDATPLARIAVGTARRHGARSLVVQHGAPRVRFGFSPLAADQMLAWGESSAQQLAAWGVPPGRISLCGSARLSPGTAARGSHSSRQIDVLLFATTRPSDARPDAVEYHLTSRTHDESLRMAMAAVAGMPRARLIVKLHPRCPDSRHVARLAGEFTGLPYRIVRRGPIERWLRAARVVLNCGSSAGIEAAQLGARVIELLPGGSRDLTPAAAWGLFGAAASFDELCLLLDQALSDPAWNGSAGPRVFAHRGRAAVSAAVDVILSGARAAENDLRERTALEVAL